MITVPAYFDDASGIDKGQQKRDMNVLRLLNEPTAAAVAYGLDSEFRWGSCDLRSRGRHLRYLVRLNRGCSISTAVTRPLVRFWLAQWIMQQAESQDDVDHVMQRRLMRDACAAKEALSEADATNLELELDTGNIGAQS